MLLPTKGIGAERALLTVGGGIVGLLESPATVSALWERFTDRAKSTGSDAVITFDWFAYALSMLFTVGAVDWNKNGQLERRRVYP